MAYEKISDGHGGRYWVPIDPPMHMGPLEDEEDTSDADEEAEPMPVELVAPPLDAVDDVLHQIL